VTDADDQDRAPAWFTQALAAPVELGEVVVDGVPIRFRAWGATGAPGAVLLHGGAAHARWWDHIAPHLADGYRVIAPDLSGHGTSGRRDRYSMDSWAADVLAVIEAGGSAPRPVLIGHSMGGMVALRAAARYGPQLRGAVVLDALLREATPEEEAAREGRAFGPLRIYPTREAAIARFRTLPDQLSLPYVLAHVAETSVRELAGGWSWRFDPAVFGRDTANDGLLPTRCPTLLMFAEFGLLNGAEPSTVLDDSGRVVPTVEIPAATHHVMLDSPLALITSLRTLVTVWHRLSGDQV
jgi:pimeloyl-ACP methyl ester carboxylesterase